jgi:hypothetical protein
MSANSPCSVVFACDARFIRQWCLFDARHDPSLFTDPFKAMPDGMGQYQQSVKRIPTHKSDVCCPPPSRWERRSCFLEEKI